MRIKTIKSKTKISRYSKHLVLTHLVLTRQSLRTLYLWDKEARQAFA